MTSELIIITSVDEPRQNSQSSTATVMVAAVRNRVVTAAKAVWPLLSNFDGGC
jgi:hypothetical protein